MDLENASQLGPSLSQTSKSDLEFEKFLAQEILKSERLRTTILTVLFLVVSIIIFLIGQFNLKALQTPFHEIPIFYWLTFLLMGGFLYELGACWYLYRLSVLEVRFWLFPYVTVFIEVGIPTTGLYLFSQSVPPEVALTAPPLFAYGGVITLAALHLNVRLCVYTGILAGLMYLVIALFLLLPLQGTTETTSFLTNLTQHALKALILTFTGWIAAFVAWEVKKRLINTFQLRNEKDHILDVFGQQVSKHVVKNLLSEEGGQGQLRRVCVMFLDIRNFTSKAERLSPEATVDYLNAVFEDMIVIINQHGGIINKFLGDGFMALFGPPFSQINPSMAAFHASHEILKNIEIKIQTQQLPLTEVGIGLHTGEVLTGNIGSSIRKEFTVIGDVVNLASRIEQMNKQVSSKLLISQEVFIDLEGTYKPLQTIEDVMVKGRKEAIVLYRMA